jgi:hypothetical protein
VSGVIFESSVLLGLLPDTASGCLSFPVNSTPRFFQALWFFRDGGPIAAVALFSRRKRKKNRRGEKPRGGVSWAAAEARVTLRPANLRHAFIKRGGCRYDSRLWNPEIALTTLMSGHAASTSDRPAVEEDSSQ